MTKKYEKFEEWMVGKTVLWDGEKGVVTREYEGEGNCVWVEWESPLDGEGWIEVESLTFLDIPCSDAQSQSNDTPIPWEVGQEVFCLLRGKGFVVCVGDEDEGTPYTVEVDFGYTFDRYTIDGKIYDDHKGRVLFFSEPTIIADTMPPKKPFTPTLKEGDEVLIKDKQGFFGEGTVRVVHKECDDRIYVSKDGDYFMKYDIASLQVIGEEIKWEN